MNKYPLVKIKWADSYGCSSSWQELTGQMPEPHYCYSVGWMVEKTEQMILLVPHLSPANEHNDSRETGCGDMTIPVSAVVELFELEKREDGDEELRNDNISNTGGA